MSEVPQDRYQRDRIKRPQGSTCDREEEASLRPLIYDDLGSRRIDALVMRYPPRPPSHFSVKQRNYPRRIHRHGLRIRKRYGPFDFALVDAPGFARRAVRLWLSKPRNSGKRTRSPLEAAWARRKYG
ncbi:hypothetical protein KM043_005486 [Ampulex compressa]|nr:hypothetical protein KM043_005486 [Ampulex compressa]